MFSRPKILFLVSLLFIALLNPKFNPYLLFKFLIFYHSSNIKDVISGCMWCDMAKYVEICDLSDGNVNCYWWKCELLLVEM